MSAAPKALATSCLMPTTTMALSDGSAHFAYPSLLLALSLLPSVVRANEDCGRMYVNHSDEPEQS